MCPPPPLRYNSTWMDTDASDSLPVFPGRDIDSDEDEIDEDQLCPLPDAPEHTDVVLPEALVLKWISEMADALAYVHAANIIHRDIKSPNFFLVNDRTYSREHVYITKATICP